MSQNPALFKHGDFWCIRPYIVGKQRLKQVCPVEGPGSIQDKALREKAKLKVMSDLGLVAGEISDSVKHSVTFREVGNSWLETLRSGGVLHENTLRLYAHYLFRHAYPVLGDLPLAQVKLVQVKTLVQRMIQDKVSRSVMDDVITNVIQVIESLTNDDGEPLFQVKWKRKQVGLPKSKKRHTKAFTAEQVEAIIERAQGQYKVLFALLAGTGLRISEALGIELGADRETTTTLSKDCRVIYVRSITLQTGKKQDDGKTMAAEREVDVHPTLAGLLLQHIGNRTSGYLFCTDSGKPILQANLYKNVMRNILWDRKRPILKRDVDAEARLRKKMNQTHATIWKHVDDATVPGVIGPRPETKKTGYNEHSFRSFRVTYLRTDAGVPDAFVKFWVGHGAKNITDEYTRLLENKKARREMCEKAGLGFNLTSSKLQIVKGKDAA